MQSGIDFCPNCGSTPYPGTVRKDGESQRIYYCYKCQKQTFPKEALAKKRERRDRIFSLPGRETAQK